MGASARHGCLVAAACLCAALAACDEAADRSPGPAARTPAPAPRVVLTADDRELWAPRPPDRSVVPVLLYHGVPPKAFARQMALLDRAGYDTITLEEFVRFIRREKVGLPPRPLLLTFDGGRADAWIESDAILAELGFNAVVFVDVGRVDANRQAEYLTWKELDALEHAGRWEVQLQSGTGNHEIQYGPGPEDVGPFYAYRGSEERIDGWRERVFSDITWGEEQLSARVSGYRSLAFAPPYGIRPSGNQRPPDPARAAGAADGQLRRRLHAGPQRLRVPTCGQGRTVRPDRDQSRGQRSRPPRAPQSLSRAASRSGAGPVRSRARRRRCPPTGRPSRRAAA